jgi:hypothetical protein
MAPVCQNLAVQARSASAVSEALREIIGGMPTDRAIALLGGAKATNAEEAEVQQRLISANKALQKAS